MEDERIKELVGKGIAYMGALNYEKATQVFKEVLAVQKDDIELYIHLSNAYTNVGNYNEAKKIVKVAIQKWPSEGFLYFHMGSICFLDNNWVEAVKYMNNAEAAGYKSVEMFGLKAAIFTNSEDYKQAEREMSKAIKLAPLRVELYLRKAGIQLQLKQIDSALDTAETLMSLVPDAWEAYDLMYRIFLEKSENAKAEDVVKKGIERFPDDLMFQSMLLNVYNAANNKDKIIKQAEKIIANSVVGKIKKDAVVLLGKIYAESGDLNNSKKVLEQYNTETFDDDVKFLLINIYSAEKDYQKLNVISDELRKSDTSKSYYAAASFAYIESVFNISGPDKAKPMYEDLSKELRKISIESPEIYEIYIYRIMIHIHLKEFEKGLELCDFLSDINPSGGDGSMFRYQIYKAQGKLDLAEKEKEIVLALNPDINVVW